MSDPFICLELKSNFFAEQYLKLMAHGQKYYICSLITIMGKYSIER